MSGRNSGASRRLRVPHLTEVMLREETSTEMVAAVRHGDLDVAIISYLPGAAPDGLWIHEVVTEPILAVMARAHPLADNEAVTLEQVVDCSAGARADA